MKFSSLNKKIVSLILSAAISTGTGISLVKTANAENIKKNVKVVTSNDYDQSYKVAVITNKLEENGMRVFILGDGDKIINQYPTSKTSLYKNSVVVLLTNNYNKIMPNLIGLSYKDAYNIFHIIGDKILVFCFFF